MPVQLSAVTNSQPRRIPGFTSQKYVDLRALGVYGAPLVVLDDFRVEELPFSAHPHAGFAAVTYVFEDSPGALRSRSSLGSDIVVGGGGIVWTQAGSGVIHEEVPAVRGRELHGLQLFVNLSAKRKLSPPRVLSLEANNVPEWHNDSQDRVRVVVGSFQQVASPLVPDEPFTMLDVALRTQIAYAVEPARNTVVYVVDGSIRVRADSRAERVGAGQAIAVSGRGSSVTFEAVSATHLLVMSGIEINEPLVEEGPFLMNDRSQIEAAIARYRSGAMGGLSPI